MINKFLVWILWFYFSTLSPSLALMDSLSKNSEVSILTFGPDQSQLYSSFWHSGIRVRDIDRGLDVVYNYGIFDFDNPNFYTDFAKGFLRYKIGYSSTKRVFQYYIRNNRSIEEQILNLTHIEKHQLFEFLETNKKPENRYYFYDYFYNNCATKIRDVVLRVIQHEIRFDTTSIYNESSFRELIELCTEYQPWGKFGIDLALGSNIDYEIKTYDYMFLPSYVRDSFKEMYVKLEDKEVPLVKSYNLIFKPTSGSDKKPIFTPITIFWTLLVFTILYTLIEYRINHYTKWLDLVLFLLSGLLGLILASIWLFTDHNDAANNYNLLWAVPLNFPFALCFFFLSRDFIRKYCLTYATLLILLVLSWYIIPQSFNNAFFPIILMLVVRSVAAGMRSNRGLSTM